MPEREYFITEGVHGEGKTYHLLGGNCADYSVVYVKEDYVVSKKDVHEGKEVTHAEGYWTCNGTRIDKIYTSMGACARLGAYPCNCAVNYNE